MLGKTALRRLTARATALARQGREADALDLVLTNVETWRRSQTGGHDDGRRGVPQLQPELIEALALAEDLAAKSTEDPAKLLARVAALMLALGKAAEAGQAFERSAALHESFEACMGAAWCIHALSGDAREGLGWVERALAQRPGDADAEVARAEFLLALDLADEARPLLNKMRRRPESAARAEALLELISAWDAARKEEAFVFDDDNQDSSQ